MIKKFFLLSLFFILFQYNIFGETIDVHLGSEDNIIKTIYVDKSFGRYDNQYLIRFNIYFDEWICPRIEKNVEIISLTPDIESNVINKLLKGIYFYKVYANTLKIKINIEVFKKVDYIKKRMQEDGIVLTDEKNIPPNFPVIEKEIYVKAPLYNFEETLIYSSNKEEHIHNYNNLEKQAKRILKKLDKISNLDDTQLRYKYDYYFHWVSNQKDKKEYLEKWIWSNYGFRYMKFKNCIKILDFRALIDEYKNAIITFLNEFNKAKLRATKIAQKKWIEYYK